MAPGVAYFLVFHYGALAGTVIAFKDYVPFDGLWASQWVGLDNFQTMFGDPDFWSAVLNTVWIALLQLVFFFPVPIALAMLLHSLTSRSVREFVQSVAYLPHFLSCVVAVFQQVLGETGLLNNVLGDAHLHTVDIAPRGRLRRVQVRRPVRVPLRRRRQGPPEPGEPGDVRMAGHGPHRRPHPRRTRPAFSASSRRPTAGSARPSTPSARTPSAPSSPAANR
ncbi:hypothetical protein OG900_18135 [Streptomyces sp. NBC_00433]